MSDVLTGRPTAASRRALAAVAILSLIAAALSGYMWVLSIGLRAKGLAGPLPGCPETDLVSCGEVLASRYSRWLGIPLAGAGTVNYLLLMAAGFGALLARSWRGRHAFWAAGLALAGLGTLCGVWLLVVQVAFIHRLCPLCDVTHACGLVSLILLAVWRPATAPTDAPVRPTVGVGGAWAVAGAVALGGTAALVLGQLLFKPEVIATSIVVPAVATQAHGPSDTRPAAASRPGGAGITGLHPVNNFQVTDSAGTVIATLDLDNEIVMGDPNAQRTVVEFMDFGCHECAGEFKLLQQVWQKHPHWFRMVVLLFPGNKECNAYTNRMRPHVCEVARAALAVRKHSPQRYYEVHELFLKLQATPLTGGMAWQLTRQMIGIDDAELQAWQDDGTLLDRIKRDCEILHSISVAEHVNRVLNLPVLMANGKLIDGAAESAGDLEKYLTQLIGPPDGALESGQAPMADAITVSRPGRSNSAPRVP